MESDSCELQNNFITQLNNINPQTEVQDIKLKQLKKFILASESYDLILAQKIIQISIDNFQNQCLPQINDEEETINQINTGISQNIIEMQEESIQEQQEENKQLQLNEDIDQSVVDEKSQNNNSQMKEDQDIQLQIQQIKQQISDLDQEELQLQDQLQTILIQNQSRQQNQDLTNTQKSSNLLNSVEQNFIQICHKFFQNITKSSQILNEGNQENQQQQQIDQNKRFLDKIQRICQVNNNQQEDKEQEDQEQENEKTLETLNYNKQKYQKLKNEVYKKLQDQETLVYDRMITCLEKDLKFIEKETQLQYIQQINQKIYKEIEKYEEINDKQTLNQGDNQELIEQQEQVFQDIQIFIKQSQGMIKQVQAQKIQSNDFICDQLLKVVQKLTILWQQLPEILIEFLDLHQNQNLNQNIDQQQQIENQTLDIKNQFGVFSDPQFLVNNLKELAKDGLQILKNIFRDQIQIQVQNNGNNSNILDEQNNNIEQFQDNNKDIFQITNNLEILQEIQYNEQQTNHKHNQIQNAILELEHQITQEHDFSQQLQQQFEIYKQNYGQQLSKYVRFRDGSSIQELIENFKEEYENKQQ